MRKLRIVNKALLVLLGVATGAVKLAQMPEEMALFANVGMGTLPTILFGVAQVVFAVLVVPRKTQRVGGAGLALTFVFATGVLFANAMVAFGVFSVLFIAMAGLAAAKVDPPTDQARQRAAI